MSCCWHCYEELRKIDVNAARSWKNLCEAYIEKRMTGIAEHRIPQFVPVLRLLERHNYIVTADALNQVHLRINGYACVNGMETFCLHRKLHDSGNSQSLQEQ